MSVRHWLAWLGGGAAVAVLSASFMLWGAQGPLLLFDAVIGYCF